MKQKKLSARSVQQVLKILDDGKQLVISKKFSEAISTFTKGLEIDPLNLELLFYRAVWYLDFNQPDNTVKDWNSVLNIKADYKKLVYLIMSIAHKRLNKEKEALMVLWEGLKYFPKYSELYLARAQLHMQMRQYKNALSDFKLFGKYASKKYAGLIGEADALKKLGRVDEAIQTYSRCINKEVKMNSKNHYNTALEKRALTYFHIKNYPNAKNDFQLLEKEV